MHPPKPAPSFRSASLANRGTCLHSPRRARPEGKIIVLIIRAGLTALFAVTITAYAADIDKTKGRIIRFDSKQGFSVEYPSSWRTYSGSQTNLDIMSGDDRLEAVIIPRGEAMISVYESQSVGQRYYLSLNKTDDSSDTITQYENIQIRKSNRNSCETVTFIESTAEVGPQTFYRERHFYCPIANRLFVLALTQWLGDLSAPNAYDIAIAMLKSLNLKQPKPSRLHRKREGPGTFGNSHLPSGNEHS